MPALMLAYINMLLVTVRTRAEGVGTRLRLCYLLFPAPVAWLSAVIAASESM